MPVDIRITKELDDGVYENYIKTLPRVQNFLKQNEGYSYTKEELYELFPEIRKYGPSMGFRGLPGVVELKNDIYSYFSMEDPDSEEYKKIHPIPLKKKSLWESIFG